jgi:hypothetical protein
MLLACWAAVAVPAHATVFKCVDRDGQVVYANSPCEALGARVQRKLGQHELRGNVVRMPSTAQPRVTARRATPGPAAAGDAGGDTILPGLQIREGPAEGRPGGPRSVVLEHARRTAGSR